jgi:predicted nucleic-acid-binding protein
MIAADTNVWARAYLDDNATQTRRACVAIKAACEADGIFVLAEPAWVLRGRWERERVLDTLEEILTTDGVFVESRTVAERALVASRVGTVGLADLLIAEVSFAGGVSEIITFDRAFGRLSRVRRLN